MPSNSGHDAEFWAQVETQRRLQSTKLCLAESKNEPCNSPIIQAHTIPRSQLQQIADNNHVISADFSADELKRRDDGTIGARRVGIQKFSVLNCFCAKHDKEVFAPIEDTPLDFSLPQISLLHYRTIASELYRKATSHGSTLEHIKAIRKKRPQTAREASQLQFLKSMAFGQQLGMRDIGAAFAQAELDAFSQSPTLTSALIIRFRRMPTIMTVGGFLPEFDYQGNKLQSLGDANQVCTGISFNILAARGHAAVALLWFKNDIVVEGFARSFLNEPRDLYTTLAIQTAFEHLENTCMAPNWWNGLRKVEQESLLRRLATGGSPLEARKSSCLTFAGIKFDDWEYVSHEFINCP